MNHRSLVPWRQCHDNGKQQELCPCGKLRNQFIPANSAQCRSHQSCTGFLKGTSLSSTSIRHSTSHHRVCFSDQFAFRPTGLTTAALIALLHTVCLELSANPTCISSPWIFFKAFDTVWHAKLMEKMAQLPIPDQVFNCRINCRDVPTAPSLLKAYPS